MNRNLKIVNRNARSVLQSHCVAARVKLVKIVSTMTCVKSQACVAMRVCVAARDKLVKIEYKRKLVQIMKSESLLLQ